MCSSGTVRHLLYNIGPIAHLSAGDINLPLSGSKMSDRESLVHNSGLAVLIENDKIISIDDSSKLCSEFGKESISNSIEITDCEGFAMIPGFVDCHTHLLWDGDRSNEMQLRNSGHSYKDIANMGGGISKTVKATRNASELRLAQLGKSRLLRALNFGTTTMECKSGYGLSTESELLLLSIIGQLNNQSTMDLHPTWLGAHDFPFDKSKDSYFEDLLTNQLPKVISQGIAKWADVFCEPGWYNLEQTEEIVRAASKSNLPSRLHVDEFVDSGGLALAAELGCVSGDHVGHSSDNARSMANSAGCMQTFLPGTPYILGKELNLPLRKCIDNNWAFSLATDFNPNYNSLSIPFVGSLATHRLGLEPLEALIAVTRNPASTLFRKDDNHISGSIRVGGPADLLIINSKEIDGWCQYPGDNPVMKTISKGITVKS